MPSGGKPVPGHDIQAATLLLTIELHHLPSVISRSCYHHCRQSYNCMAHWGFLMMRHAVPCHLSGRPVEEKVAGFSGLTPACPFLWAFGSFYPCMRKGSWFPVRLVWPLLSLSLKSHHSNRLHCLLQGKAPASQESASILRNSHLVQI